MSSGGLYLFTGPDRPRKFQRIQALERSLGIQPFDRHHLDAAAVSSSDLVALARQQPAASPVRLIVVDQAQRLDGPGVDALLQHAAVIAKSACLVLLVEVELTQRHPLARAVPRGMAGSRLAIENFPERQSASAKPFALTDALGHQDLAGALTAVQDQLVAGKEPLELLGLVAWQVNRWVMIKRLRDAGYGTEQMVSATGLRPWQVERLQTEVARRSLESLERALTRCWQFDVDAKRGRAIPDLAVEQLVVELCRPEAIGERVG